MRTIYAILLLCFLNDVIDAADPLVTTTYGVLRGSRMKSRSGRAFEAFQSIPYAAPPTGKLRFMPPQPPAKWTGVKDATKVHTSCLQMNLSPIGGVIGSEDCLFLNVYTRSTADRHRHPVMVWIHGGAFAGGVANSEAFEPDYLLDKDVVLVSINYRLGPIGFLSTGDDVVPGNNAFKDQVMALRWIKDNIARFGGDTKSITIFGESTGAASTHHIALSPLSQGLVHKAVSQSGNAFCRWALQTKAEALKSATTLAEIFNCPTASTAAMVECLQGVSGESIIEKHTLMFEWQAEPDIIFKPVLEDDVEGSFMPDFPENLVKSGRANDIPWIVGVNTGEGTFKGAPYAARNLLGELDDDFSRIWPITISFNKNILKDVISDIRSYYFGGRRIQDAPPANVSNLYTDSMFFYCSDEAINVIRKYHKQPIYYYLFGYEGNRTLTGGYYYGVSHGDELNYLFPHRQRSLTPLNEEDTAMSEIMVNLWTNFANYGTPNSPGKILWKPVTSESMEYLDISGPPQNLAMKTDMFKERRDFWRGLKLNGIS